MAGRSKFDYLAPAADALRRVPQERRPKCTKHPCRCMLVHNDDGRKQWRCLFCLNYITVDDKQGSLF